MVKISKVKFYDKFNGLFVDLLVSLMKKLKRSSHKLPRRNMIGNIASPVVFVRADPLSVCMLLIKTS